MKYFFFLLIKPKSKGDSDLFCTREQVTFLLCYLFLIFYFSLQRDYKGSLREIWRIDNLTSLKTLKTFIEKGTQPSVTQIKTSSHFTTNNDVSPEGRRDRAFFLCPLTAEYEFHFSCNGSCEWSVKETENSSAAIAAGISLQPMGNDEMNS